MCPTQEHHGLKPDLVWEMDLANLERIESFSINIVIPYTHDAWCGRIHSIPTVGGRLGQAGAGSGREFHDGVAHDAGQVIPSRTNASGSARVRGDRISSVALGHAARPGDEFLTYPAVRRTSRGTAVGDSGGGANAGNRQTKVLPRSPSPLTGEGPERTVAMLATQCGYQRGPNW